MQGPGLIVAPLTPFISDLTLDEPALQRQIDYTTSPDVVRLRVTSSRFTGSGGGASPGISRK